ncbi:MAG: T9SS type A sorting domain-containing protein [Bacteroidetes bacterium]|nr:T9SS type A sorting domain-containing protein [Bacteroidota bacterium]MBL6964340.1 T9SS type A sorting domain-containing protein [Bacteroidota bacterium]
MKIIGSFALGLLITINLFAQEISPEVKASAGDYYVHVDGSISFTVGEVIVETLTDANNILTQGFQQSDYKLSVIEEKKHAGFQLSLFPNPVKDGFTINYHIQDHKPLVISLYDMNGKLLRKKKLNNNSNYINLSDFSSGSYMVRVQDTEGISIGKYKVQKIKNR